MRYRLVTQTLLFTTLLVAGCDGVEDQDAITSDVANGDADEFTQIDLSAKETQHLLTVNGIEDPDAISGVLVIPSILTDDEIEDYKATLFTAPEQSGKDITSVPPPPQAFCGGEFLVNVKNVSDVYGNSYIRISQGWGPGNLGIEVNDSVSATWSTNAGVNASVVTAGVGYSVTSSYNVTSTWSTFVPSGKFGTIKAYPRYSKKIFDVVHDACFGADYYVGYGHALRPVGVLFTTSIK